MKKLKFKLNNSEEIKNETKVKKMFHFIEAREEEYMKVPYAIARFYNVLNPKTKCAENEFAALC
jgi:hypothetical protein